ncbi:MAG: sugar phosphate isomerase/epimerase [Chloroflexi bacterium]|nr:sugar phosphate isomerase/epimerase [Chloroflexota bacterium]
MSSLSLCSWSLHRHLPRGDKKPTETPISLIDFIRIARERYNIAQVELCQMHLESTKHSYLDKIKAAVTRHSVRIINMPIDVGNISQLDPEKRETDIQLIMHWMDAAAYLGIPAVRINSGRQPEGQEDLQITINSYRTLVSYGKMINCKVLMENHGGISADPWNIEKIVYGVNSNWFRLCPDFGNFEPALRYEGLQTMMPLAALVHAKTLDFDAEGNHTAFDFSRCMRIIGESGYDGPLSIEFEGKSDQYEGIAKSRDLLLRYVAAPAA